MKIVLQDGVKDCGVCSLLSIIRFYGGDVSKEYLRELTNTTKNGVSAFDLIEGAKNYSLQRFRSNFIDKSDLDNEMYFKFSLQEHTKQEFDECLNYAKSKVKKVVIKGF